jgi:uncharacterized protein
MTAADSPLLPAVQPAPRLVLDTNVVLDWLLFRDPGVAALAAALDAGTVHWIVCPRMRDEFARTLQYANLAAWSPDSERLLASFDAHCTVLPAPASLPALRCRDADDQVFIDLAVGAGAQWLLTHDRALLQLRRRALAAGVRVLRPRDWVASAG